MIPLDTFFSMHVCKSESGKQEEIFNLEQFFYCIQEEKYSINSLGISSS